MTWNWPDGKKLAVSFTGSGEAAARPRSGEASVRTFRSSVLPPRERGEEFGRHHAGEIAACVAAYRDLFEQAAGGPVDLVRLGADASAAIEAVSPPLAAEIGGIAAGAGLSVGEIAAINARTEILALLNAATPVVDGVGPEGRGAPGAIRGECSTVVHLGEPGRPLGVQAWDWYESLSGSWFVWEIPHADGGTTTTLTEFGIVGKIGVNTAGLGVLFNILHHERDGERIGAPVHVLARALLDGCTDLNQALVLLAGAPVSASSALTLVAAAPGESAAVSVELNPARIGYCLPDDGGLLTHTNHFLTRPAADGDTEPVTGPDTVVRLDLLRRRLSGRAAFTAADVLTAMNSHLLGGGGLCCHPDESLPPAARFRTLATVVLDPAAGTLAAVPGGPCTHPLIAT